MNEVLKHVGVFLGILSFFSGIAVLTVNLMFCEGKKNRYYLILRRYHFAFFAYILTIFAYYYVEQFILDVREVAVLNVIGNLTLAILCVSHAKIITFLNQTERSRRYWLLVAGNIVYVAGWIIINIFWVNAEGYVDIQPGISVVWIVESILLFTLLYFEVGEYRTGQKNKWFLFFLGIFVIEYIWEVMYDLAIAESFFMFTNFVSPFNITFLIYFVVNLILLSGFYHRVFREKIEEAGKSAEPYKVEEMENGTEKAETVVKQEETRQESSRENELEKQMKEYDLTARECEVLQLILDKKGNQEIAEILFISNNTVKHHVSNIFKKTGVSRRMDLIWMFQKEL